MWFLKHEVAAQMQRAWDAGLGPTAEQREEFVARAVEADALSNMPRNMKVAGDVAEIRVEGVLTQKPDFFAWLFGGGNTTYEQIQSGFALAAADPNIKRVSLWVDSPGGHVHGLFDTLAAIEAFGKPISVRAAMADSAAYALASVAGKIEATNAAAEFGSIGVAASFFRDEDVVDITSTEAPNKRPDVSTDEGKAVVREYLDAIHELFADAIARGRATTVANVNKTFGRGGVLLAGEAKKRGMIDKIAKPQLRAVEVESAPTDPDDPVAGAEGTKPTPSAAGGGVQPRKKQMTEEELRAQHPELYAAVFGKGQEQGVTSERKRVLAHLKLGESTGAAKIAHSAIASGVSTLDEEVHAEYMSAALNRRDSQNRQADSDDAGRVADAAKPAPAAEDLVDLFAGDLPAKVA